MALIVGPVVASKYLKLDFAIPMDLLQPVGLNNNDTTTKVTGSCVLGVCPGPGGSGDAAETSSSSDSRRFARFVAF